MSHTQPISTPSNFQQIFDNALKAYKRRTGNDLLKHPLTERLNACDSSNSILAVLQELVQEPNQSQRNYTKWLDPTVNVLLTFSETLGEGVSSVFSPAKVIFIGFGVLLSTIKDVRADQEALFEIFERIEAFFRRLDIYTKVAPNQGMADTITAIMVEILNFLAIATKEVKYGRMKKYLKKLIKKLIGNNEIEDALRRLDRLTQEEARMAAAQLLEITDAINSEVKKTADNVLVVNDRVAGVNDRVAGVDEHVADVDKHVAGIGDQVQGVDDKVTAVMNDGREAREVIQQAAGGVYRIERNQLRQDLRRWLSPQDPSTNHNIARNAHHKGTATWFFEGRTYQEWKSTGSESQSLLWIHGKPGSGKSILCSAIIEDVKTLCDPGQSSILYFYFDFRDINKQRLRDLVPPLLTQLSTQSSPCCDILSRLYSDHDNGARQPDDDALKRCLIEMLTVPDGHPIYLIMDALDECPDTSEVPSPRNRILRLLKELVELRHPNLRICVTSRPEFDIRDFLEPLTSRQVSLHDQSGQKQDIADYVRSVVYSDSEPIMRRWKKEDKEFVIKTLSERADGMFRWIFCQLELLRQCLPPSVRRTLKELPKSLDETYERILKEIKKPNKDIALRVLQCLVAATRPLRVTELAEVLAVDFDDAEGIPRLNSGWRWEDQELGLLIACSSLIAIVEPSNVEPSDSNPEAEIDDGDSRVEADDSDWHVEADDGDLHVEADDGGLHVEADDGELHVEADDDDSHVEANDADSHVDADDDDLHVEADDGDSHVEVDDGDLHIEADHGGSHVEAGDSRIVQFSHFSVKEFLTSSRIATTSGEVSNYHIDSEPAHTILAQACLGVLLQIQDDVEGCTPKDHPLAGYAAKHWTTHAQLGKVSSRLHKGMEYLFDANKPHFNMWITLYDIDIGTYPDDVYATFYWFSLEVKSPAAPLYYAALCGFHDLAEHLITKHPQDMNADGGHYVRPLVAALAGEHFQTADLLRDKGADLDIRGFYGKNPLHGAAQSGNLKVIRKLIEYNPAYINDGDGNEETPLHWASRGHDRDGSAVRLLLEHGADVNAQSSSGLKLTALHLAAEGGKQEVMRVLLEHGANVELTNNYCQTASQAAAYDLRWETVEFLRKYEAK